MEKMVANAPKALIGTDDGVRLLDVLVGKCGIKTKRSAFVKQDTISMEVFAYFVLTGSNGTKEGNLANAQEIMCGMETTVKRNSSVRETGFIMNNINNVFANKNSFGMASIVWFNRNAVAEKSGIKRPSLVTVPMDSNLMVIIVCYASTGKDGIPHKTNVLADKVLSGMDSSAL